MLDCVLSVLSLDFLMREHCTICSNGTNTVLRPGYEPRFVLMPIRFASEVWPRPRLTWPRLASPRPRRASKHPRLQACINIIEGSLEAKLRHMDR